MTGTTSITSKGDSDVSKSDSDVSKSDSDVSKSDADAAEPASEEVKNSAAAKKKVVVVHWFRQDLRVHDNPALCEALKECDEFYPVFIYDGKVASSEHSEFHRARFLRECLQDLDKTFQYHGGRLYVFQGTACETLKMLFQEWGVTRLTYENEPEALWKARDDEVQALCEEMRVQRITATAHTLWDPHEIIKKNGGFPPLTYTIFKHVTSSMGLPEKPLGLPDFSRKTIFAPDFDKKFELPSYSELGFGEQANLPDKRINKWKGGEEEALLLLHHRLLAEEVAFASGYTLPYQYIPDLCTVPKSLSGHLKFGCLSIRRLYWAIQDTYLKISGTTTPDIKAGIVAQLIWREFFYTMSAQNINYSRVKDNPICLPIPWYEDGKFEVELEMGKTGYPFVDAIMNQLREEGWIHHVGRHMVASYLTRGDLWQSWEVGVRIFEKYLIDYDWSICAGNWMWVSSSAFEKALDCPKCFDPVKYGQRMDPNGIYVRRYVPALKKMPLKYLFQPWLAPERIQREAGCMVGTDYPNRINDHRVSARECNVQMERTRKFMADQIHKHCSPSNGEELREYVWLPDHMATGTKCTGDAMCAGISGL